MRNENFIRIWITMAIKIKRMARILQQADLEIQNIICTFANRKTRTMKSKAEILQLLSLYKPTAESKYGLTRIGIFGSVARDMQTENSDVDICYEGAIPSLLTLDLIQADLEQLFNCRVDMVRIRDNMNALLKKRIEKEAVYV